MTTAMWSMLLYAVAMIGMGIHGTVKAGEWMSLVGGGGMGVVVLVALFLSLKLKSPRWGYILALLVALGALGMYVPKLMKGTADAYPGGTIVALSALLILVLLGGHLSARTKPAS